MKTLAQLLASSTWALLLATGVLAGPVAAGPAAAGGAVQGSSAEAWSVEPFLGVWRAVQEDGAESDSVIEIARDYLSVVRAGKLDHREKVLAAERGGLLVGLFGNRRKIALELPTEGDNRRRNSDR